MNKTYPDFRCRVRSPTTSVTVLPTLLFRRDPQDLSPGFVPTSTGDPTGTSDVPTPTSTGYGTPPPSTTQDPVPSRPPSRYSFLPSSPHFSFTPRVHGSGTSTTPTPVRDVKSRTLPPVVPGVDATVRDDGEIGPPLTKKYPPPSSFY